METTTSIYEEIGVVPVINAMGNYTVLGGSTPSPRIRAAMERAERSYVDMAELLAKSGDVVARLLGAEAAYITPGAAAAIALGTAACITGTDLAKIARLPHTLGMKNKVVIQKVHHYPYERAATIVGTTLVEVGDDAGTRPEQLEAALGPETASVLHVAHLEPVPGSLSLRQVLEVAHGKGVPVVVDAAGQVYPLARFKSFTQLGADLVCFGAKYIGAVNSSGILCGRKDLVAAASMQGFIGFETVADHQAFGRPLKIDRQEVVAVVVALREWLAMDHERRVAELERKLRVIGSHVERLAGVSLEYLRAEGSSPRALRIALDPATARRSAGEVHRALREGSPSIYAIAQGDLLWINPACFFEGDEEIIGRRLVSLLSEE